MDIQQYTIIFYSYYLQYNVLLRTSFKKSFSSFFIVGSIPSCSGWRGQRKEASAFILYQHGFVDDLSEFLQHKQERAVFVKLLNVSPKLRYVKSGFLNPTSGICYSTLGILTRFLLISSLLKLHANVGQTLQ
jgi:hypothetical protein